MPMPKHPSRVVALVAAALAALLVSGCSLQADVATSTLPPRSLISQPAPPFSGTLLNGRNVDLSEFRGHPLVIEFWATWCAPCHAEQGDINAVVSQFAGRGVAFLGDDMHSDPRADALAFVNDFHVMYPSVSDPSNDVASAYDIPSPPYAVVVDRSGTIRLRDPGTMADVPEVLNRLLSGA
jgi:cytochrome c biogenesis protein CcmG/thiol:disulfide interchange protein DsbE